MDTKSIVVWNVFWLEMQSSSVRIEEDCYIRSEDIAFICVHGHKAKPPNWRQNICGADGAKFSHASSAETKASFSVLDFPDMISASKLSLATS